MGEVEDRVRGRVDRARGDAAAVPSFEEFVAVRSTALLRTSYLLTRDHALAEDLLQAALSKAWLAWDRVDRDAEPYVRRILVTTYTSWWRRRSFHEPATGVAPETTPATTAPDAADHVARSEDLWVALGRLPRRQRAVVVLRYLEDLSEAQTAEALGCSPGTVKSQASKALAKLRIDPVLDERPDGPPVDPSPRPARPARPAEGPQR